MKSKIIITILSLCLFSCSEIEENKFMGTWIMEDGENNRTIVFEKDSFYTSYPRDATKIRGKWRIQDNKLLLEFYYSSGDTLSPYFMKYTFENNNELHIWDQQSDYGSFFVWKRQPYLDKEILP